MMEFKAELSYDADKRGLYPWGVSYWRKYTGAENWLQLRSKSVSYTGESAARRGAKRELKALRKQEAHWPTGKKETVS